MSRVKSPAFLFLYRHLVLLFTFMGNAIVVGASQGIGLELSRILSSEGFTVGMTSRNIDSIEQKSKSFPNPVFARFMDVTKVDEARKIFRKLIQEMGGLDLFIYNAGIFIPGTHWENDQKVMMTNTAGFLALVTCAYEYFSTIGKGQIVGISSVSHLRGMSVSPVYSASKAFVSNYLEALALKVNYKKQNIIVTDIIPGYIDTGLTQGGKKKVFWVMPLDKAARWIWKAIRKKKRRKVINFWWRLTYFWMIRAPWFIYKRVWS